LHSAVFRNANLAVSEPIARINADGSCYYNWTSIELEAAKWQPFDTGLVRGMAKLLAGLAPKYVPFAEAWKAEEAAGCVCGENALRNVRHGYAMGS